MSEVLEQLRSYPSYKEARWVKFSQIRDQVTDLFVTDVDTDRPVLKLVWDSTEFESSNMIEKVTQGNYSWFWDTAVLLGEDHCLVGMGTLPEQNALVFGHQDDLQFDNFVNNHKIIEEFNETGSCPCPFDDDVMLRGRRFNPDICLCGRYYAHNVADDESTVVADKILSTEHEGLNSVCDYSADSFESAIKRGGIFWAIIQHAPRVGEYMEDCGLVDADAYLWAHNGQYIGALYHRGPELVGLVIANGHRRQGHGTKLVKAWYEQINYNEITVRSFGDTEDFYTELPIPTRVNP